MLKKITFINIPYDSAVVVFGLTKDQWSVDGNPEHTYFNERIKSKKKLVVDISNPKMEKILIRIRSMKYIWRRDKKYKHPVKGGYIPDLLLNAKDHEDFTFNGEDFLEIDNVMIERPKKEPILKIKNKSDYVARKEMNLHLSIEKPINLDFREEDYIFKSIVAVVKGLDHEKLEDFRQSLPRPVMNYLHFAKPIGNNYYRLAFFHYDFANLDNISESELKSKPWFYKKENAVLLFEAKKNFIALISKSISQISFLSTRELKNYGYLQEDLPLILPDIHFGDKRPLWRYLTLPKFVDLISTSQLWFAKPSTFNDPFESKTNKKTRAEHIWKMMNRILDDYNIAVYEKDTDFLNKQEWVVSELDKNAKGQVESVEYENFSEVPNNIMSFAEFKLNNLLDSQLVNSWHINDNESEGMWNLYSDSQNGVAIISDHESLRNSFRTSYGSPKILQIDYHDLHDEAKTYDYLPSAYKHIAFKHEEEVRAYLGVVMPENSLGLSVKVDLRVLIKKIIMSPDSKSWFKKNISWIIEKAGYSFIIEDSIFKNKLF